MDEFRFYRLSGKANFTGLSLGLVFATALAIPCSFVYAYAVRYIPLVFLNFLVSFGYVFVIALVYKLGERMGHNRNRALSFLGALLGCSICLYLAWAAFLTVLLGKMQIGFWQLVSNPQMMWTWIEILVKNGWFTIGSSKETVSGAFYAVLLIVEALCYFWIFLAVGMLEKDAVYCERCNKWLESKLLPIFIDIRLEPDMVRTSESGMVDWLPRLASVLPFPVNDSYITLHTTACDSCTDIYLLTAKKLLVSKNKEGNVETKESLLLQNLIMTKKEMDELQQRLQELEAASQQQMQPADTQPNQPPENPEQKA